MSLTPMKNKVPLVGSLLGRFTSTQSEMGVLVEDYCLAHKMQCILEKRSQGVSLPYTFAYVCAEHGLKRDNPSKCTGKLEVKKSIFHDNMIFTIAYCAGTTLVPSYRYLTEHAPLVAFAVKHSPSDIIAFAERTYNFQINKSYASDLKKFSMNTPGK
jgi:hypothetical protein